LAPGFFSDVRLSKNGRSCATCHDPKRAFTDGKKTPPGLSRNAPSLLYAAPQAAFFWDGRTATAATQAIAVIHSREEMGLTDEELSARTKLPIEKVGRALAAYEDTLVPATAPIDRFARGDESALTPRARAGFDVFVRARCTRCHVPPLFGGSRPTDFATPIFAALGVPKGPQLKELDPDRGRAAITADPKDERAFKTPSLRNAAKTAPYFHHGAFPTLESVLDFYLQGGGRGAGLDVPNQDPDVQKLALEPEERANILDFMRNALADD
jgi:cytochrome c peroxidase